MIFAKPSRGWTLHRLFFVLIMLVLATLSLSCFGSKAPERIYYSIDYALGSQPRYETPKYNASVVVSNVTIARAYDRQEIVYRTNPYEFQYYWYRLWASKPHRMLRELIVQHLRYAQIFSKVTLVVEDRLPDYMLEVEILAIEELDVTEKDWYARLALRMTLTRFSDGQAAWVYQFDAKQPVASNQPVFVVKAMSSLLDDELTKAFMDLDRKIASSEAAGGAPQRHLPKPPAADDRDEGAEREDGLSPAGISSGKDITETSGNSSQDPAAPVRAEPRATLRNRPKK
ncbi:MAG: PqiC family protein [Proteobacteria bacterium]|nr:PqiC family protein [Pseudomonadota bacterium]